MGPRNATRRPGGGVSAASCSGNDSTAEDSTPARLRQDLRFHRLTERIWRLGPRPVGEALLAVASGRDPFAVLEEITRFSPEVVRYVGARTWPPSLWGLSA